MQARTRGIDTSLLIIALLGPAFHLAGLLTRGVALLYSNYPRLGITYVALALSSAAGAFLLLRRGALFTRFLAGLALLASLGSVAYTGIIGSRDMQQALANVSMAPIDPTKVGILVSPMNSSSLATAQVRATEEILNGIIKANGLGPYIAVQRTYSLSSEEQACELAQRLRANVVLWQSERSPSRSTPAYHITVLGANETAIQLEPVSLLLLMATQGTLTVPLNGEDSELLTQVVAPVTVGFGALAVGQPLISAAQFQAALSATNIPTATIRMLHYDMGVALMYAGRPDLAISKFELANELAPGPEAWAGIGTVMLARYEWEAARDAFGRAVALDPYTPAPYCGLGVTYARERNVMRARSSYEQAVALQSSWGIPYAFLGLAYELEGNVDAAREAYRTCAIEAGPNISLQNMALERAEEIQRNPPTAVPTATLAPKPTGTPVPTSSLYAVQRGDTLRDIADQFKVSVEAIVELNELTDPNAIHVGQLLIIPSRP